MVITEGNPVVLVFRYMRYLNQQMNGRFSEVKPDVPSILGLMGSDDR